MREHPLDEYLAAAAEQQAFEAHAAQQRQVLDQRIQKKIVKPAKTRGASAPNDKDQGKAQDKSEGKGNSKGDK